MERFPEPAFETTEKIPPVSWTDLWQRSDDDQNPEVHLFKGPWAASELNQKLSLVDEEREVKIIVRYLSKQTALIAASGQSEESIRESMKAHLPQRGIQKIILFEKKYG